MMRNEQPVQNLAHGDGSTLAVHSTFSTIQGEALYAGWPAYFIRLSGCNLQCPLCDTEYTQGARTFGINSLVLLFESQKAPGCQLVVLTGGEPFRQRIDRFCRLLESRDYLVQVETNGTIIRDVGENTQVVCSPKTPKLSVDAEKVVDAWKYVVEAGNIDPADGLPTSALGMAKPPCRPLNSNPIYIQPCDHQDPEINKRNEEAAIEICLKFGYRLCIQVHKLVGLP